jgi:PKD repeat protein
MKRVAIPLVVLLAACGGGGSSPSGPSASANRAPTGSFVVSPSGNALLGATVMTFTASATDADGDPVQYAWNFGDGQTGSGASATHVFASAGTLTVTLTLSDSKGGSTPVTGTVIVKSLTGKWVDADPDYWLELTQAGSNFTGKVFSTWNGHVSNVTDGVVKNPRSLTFYRDSFKAGYATCDYAGTVDATGDRIQCVCVREARTTFDLRRQ